MLQTVCVAATSRKSRNRSSAVKNRVHQATAGAPGALFMCPWDMTGCNGMGWDIGKPSHSQNLYNDTISTTQCISFMHPLRATLLHAPGMRRNRMGLGHPSRDTKNLFGFNHTVFLT